MSIAEVAPWAVAGLFAVLYIIEHARSAVLTRDCMNRLQSRDLREYAALKPVLEPSKPPPTPKPQRTRPTATVSEEAVEASVMEAKEAWNTL